MKAIQVDIKFGDRRVDEEGCIRWEEGTITKRVVVSGTHEAMFQVNEIKEEVAYQVSRALYHLEIEIEQGLIAKAYDPKLYREGKK